MLKTVIVDNNIHEAGLLKASLKKYCCGYVDVTCICGNVSDAFKIISSSRPGLVFLEADMGFDLLTRFHDHFFSFIFVTGSSQYATRAIKVGALDYILKPLAIEELVAAVQKAAARRVQASPGPDTRQLPQVAASRKIAIPVSNGYTMLNVQDIMYCAASREYTYVHTAHSPASCSSVVIFKSC